MTIVNVYVASPISCTTDAPQFSFRSLTRPSFADPFSHFDDRVRGGLQQTADNGKFRGTGNDARPANGQQFGKNQNQGGNNQQNQNNAGAQIRPCRAQMQIAFGWLFSNFFATVGNNQNKGDQNKGGQGDQNKGGGGDQNKGGQNQQCVFLIAPTSFARCFNRRFFLQAKQPGRR